MNQLANNSHTSKAQSQILLARKLAERLRERGACAK